MSTPALVVFEAVCLVHNQRLPVYLPQLCGLLRHSLVCCHAHVEADALLHRLGTQCSRTGSEICRIAECNTQEVCTNITNAEAGTEVLMSSVASDDLHTSAVGMAPAGLPGSAGVLQCTCRTS